jgi:hypothetical protein
MKEKARKGASAGSSGSAGSAFWSTPAQAPGFMSTSWSPSVAEQVQQLVDRAVHALHVQDEATALRACARLSMPSDAGWQRAVARHLDDCLKIMITSLWQRGWQPVDVLRVAARRWKASQLHLVRAGLAAEAAGYAAATVDPRWSAQLAEAQVAVWWPAEQSAVRACAGSHPEGWPHFVVQAIELLHALASLPHLEVLVPIPGTAVAAPSGPRSEVDERILARVRALLAKAESTSFPAEAETFTAGAQALMARHAIDHALLAASGRAPADEPTARRIGVDNPYEAPKASLLDAVASANRCRAVWAKEIGSVTVVGHPSDLDGVEVLFMSLLVQATAAMTSQGSRTYRDGASRTRTFRQSFLLSYAGRIRERLSQATRTETETAAAEPGKANLLPVLASRDEAVERATAAMFHSLTTRSIGTAWDREGWASGRAAADLASLTPASPVSGGARA